MKNLFPIKGLKDQDFYRCFSFVRKPRFEKDLRGNVRSPREFVMREDIQRFYSEMLGCEYVSFAFL